MSTQINSPSKATPKPDGENTGESTDTSKKKFSISRVQVKPGKTLRKPEDIAKGYSTKLPSIGTKACEYKPMPYTFRVEDTPAPIKITKLMARSPPLYMLLDHTIAVIWVLFGTKEYNCPLGIAQLQWALSFLKTIRNRQGDLPVDVETCINAIEELLIDKYAELSNDLTTVKKMNDAVHYVDGAFGLSTMVTKDIPFSLNYSEMISKCDKSEKQLQTKSITSTEAEIQLDKIKKTAGVDSLERLDTESKHKVVNVLRLWKHDQVEKIKDELRRLRSIEDKMKDIDDNFDGYLEDDLEALRN